MRVKDETELVFENTMPMLESNKLPYNKTASCNRQPVGVNHQKIVVVNTRCADGQEGKHQTHLDAMVKVEAEKGFKILQASTVIVPVSAGLLFSTTVVLVS